MKEVDDFHGDSNDISRFFLKCELHFDLYNRHYRYPPHKVIFCVSRLAGDVQRWWELQARILGKLADGEQFYPAYDDFEEKLRNRFWKDADEQIKHTQWEKLRQVNYKDGDKFFQEFEELAHYTGVRGNEQVMVAQIKRAACETSKKTPYTQATETYQLSTTTGRVDYSGSTPTGASNRQKVRDEQYQQQRRPSTKGVSTGVPTQRTPSGTTYRGAGVPMDISAATATTKCYRCGKLGHFKKRLPKQAEIQGRAPPSSKHLLGQETNGRSNGDSRGGKRGCREVIDSTYSAKDLVFIWYANRA